MMMHLVDTGVAEVFIFKTMGQYLNIMAYVGAISVCDTDIWLQCMV